jgi:hypothetical protein
VNGAEFFMTHAGYKMLPTDRRTGDAVADADTLFSIMLPLSSGRAQRLSSCWMVLTPNRVATSFKLPATEGVSVGGERKAEIIAALESNEPCMFLALGKRTMTARDLFVTYDPRAVRECGQGKTRTYDATKEPSWTS